MNTNNQKLCNNKKQILLKYFRILFFLEFVSVFLVVLLVFPSNTHLFNQLLGSLAFLILGSSFLFRIFFPVEGSKDQSARRKHISPHLSKSLFSLQRPHYDPMNDTTNPASPSYYGRFNRRV